MFFIYMLDEFDIRLNSNRIEQTPQIYNLFQLMMKFDGLEVEPVVRLFVDVFAYFLNILLH